MRNKARSGRFVNKNLRLMTICNGRTPGRQAPNPERLLEADAADIMISTVRLLLFPSDADAVGLVVTRCRFSAEPCSADPDPVKSSQKVFTSGEDAGSASHCRGQYPEPAWLPPQKVGFRYGFSDACESLREGLLGGRRPKSLEGGNRGRSMCQRQCRSMGI
jgi:hypothetical protein